MPNEHLRPPFSGVHAKKLTVRVRDLSEEVQHPQGVQVVKSFFEVLLNLVISPLCFLERPVKQDLAHGWLFLSSVGCVESSISVMNDFEWMLARLLDNPIYGSTIIARPGLPALRVYLLAYLCTTEVVNVRLA